MELAVHLKEKHLALDLPPLYVRVGFAREVGGFSRRANIALAYGQHEIRLIRAIGRAMRHQRRLPRIAIYGNTVQAVFMVEPLSGELRAALARLTMPPVQNVLEVCSIASTANFASDEDFRTFQMLYATTRRCTVEIYGPHGTKIKSFEAFTVEKLEATESMVL